MGLDSSCDVWTHSRHMVLPPPPPTIPPFVPAQKGFTGLTSIKSPPGGHRQTFLRSDLNVLECQVAICMNLSLYIRCHTRSFYGRQPNWGVTYRCFFFLLLNFSFSLFWGMLFNPDWPPASTFCVLGLHSCAAMSNLFGAKDWPQSFVGAT